MKINLELILRNINAQRPVLAEKDSTKGYLRNIYRYSAGTPCREGYAYLLTAEEASDLKNQNASVPLAFIILYTMGEEYIDLPPGWNVLHMTVSWSELISFREIQQVFELYQNWENKLTDAVLHRAGIQEMLDVSTELFPNPIALFDISFSLIGYGGRIPDSFEDPIWETVVNSNYASIKNLTADFRDYYASLSTLQRLICYPEFPKPANNRILMAHLNRKGEVYAILAMDELAAKFDACDMVILDTICRKLELSDLIFQYAGFGSENGSAVFMDLLDGKHVSPVLMEHMIRTQGWMKVRQFRVVRITSPNRVDEFNESNAVTFLRRLHQASPDMRFYYHRGEIITLMDCSDEAAERHQLPERLTDLAETIGLHVGVSMLHCSFTHIREAGIQAEAVLTMKRNDTIVFFEDIIPDIVHNRLMREGSIEYFIHPAILKLEDEGKTDLLDTMYWYLETGRQLSETARKLGIHRNTVSYRLASAEDLCGIYLDELTQTQMWHLKMSYMLIEQERSRAR